MSKFSVKKPLTVFVAVVIVLVLGVVSYTSMTPDLLPNINLPYVILVTPYPGASPEKVEAEVSKPLEQAMATLDNIETVTSTSNANYSMVIMQFNDDANLDTVSVDILQQINTLSRGWDDMVSTPTIMKLNPNMLPVMVAAVDMEGLDITELSELVDGTLMNRLEGITGVASVSATGLLEEQVNIVISPQKLEALNAKIRASLDETFDETEEELREGLEELEGQLADLESGKGALNSGKDTLVDAAGEYGPMMTQNQAELASAKMLLTTELEVMYAALPELRGYEAQLAQMNDGIKQLEAAEKELADTIAMLRGIQELEKAEADAETGLAQLQAALDTLNQLDAGMAAFEVQFAALREQYGDAAEPMIEAAKQTPEYQAIEQGYAGLDAALAGFGIDRNTLPAMVATTEAGLNEVRSYLAQADAQLAANGMSRENLDATIAQLEAAQKTVATNLAEIDDMLAQLGLTRSDVPAALTEVSNARATLENSITTLEGTLAQLNAGSTTLNAAMAELEAQKLTGVLTLSETTTQMLMGEMVLNQYLTQIEDGLEQLEDAKEGAYAQADVTEIITMQMVSQILYAQNFSMPAGYVTEGDDSYLVSVGDTINSVEELSGLLLFDLGMDGIDPIYLSDVADILVVDNANEIYANINGNNGVLLSFSKQSNFATATVSDNIADAFELLQTQYPGLTFTPLMDQGDYIYIVVRAVISNLLWGAVLAVIVLFLFLKSIKPSIITLASIPISILFAFTLMYFSGVNLNMFSLAGLAVAVGMLVDNSVVVIENIFRLRNKGVSAIQAAVSGAAQVGGAIAASTITTICVFLPIVFVEGLTRDLFTDFALTFAYALIASLIIALTVVPSMSARLLRNNVEKPAPYFDKFLARYRKMLKWTLNHKLPILAGSVVLLVLSGFLALTKGFSFMPDMDMGQLTVSFTMPEGSELSETAEESNIAVDRILGIEGVETVGAMSGGGSSMLNLGGGSSSGESVTMYVLLEEGTRRGTKEIGDEILALTEDLSAEISVSSSSGMDISMLSGSGVSVDLYGDNLDQLQSTARDLAATLATVEGVASTSDGIDDTSPEIRFVVDKNKAMEQGLTVAQVYAALMAELTTETTATSISYDGESYDVVVIGGDADELTPSYIKNYMLTVTDRQGETKEIRIGSIAEIVDTETMNSIRRVDGLRTLSVTAEIADGYNVSLVARAIEAKLNDYQLPSGFRYELSGENETIMESMWELLKMLGLGVLLVYLVMVAQFQSLKSPFIVMFTIPLAFTGGLLALLISGNDVSVISMIGFVMLVGIIVNNGIVLVDYVNQLRAEGVETREALLEAGATRMRPILMTTITTVFGLLTMAFGMGTGAEIMQPIAIVCIGGLLYATLLTLFVVPAIYEMLNKGKKLEVIDDSELEMVEE